MALHIKLMTWEEYRYKSFLKSLEKLYPLQQNAVKVPPRQHGNHQFSLGQYLLSSIPEAKNSSFQPYYLLSVKDREETSKTNIQLHEKLFQYFDPNLLSHAPGVEEKLLLPISYLLNELVHQYPGSEKNRILHSFATLLDLCSPSQKNSVDFLLDFFLTPSLYVFSYERVGETAAREIHRLENQLSASGNIVANSINNSHSYNLDLGVSTVFVRFIEDPKAIAIDKDHIPPTALRVLVAFNHQKLSANEAREWDLLICKVSEDRQLIPTEKPWRGWISVNSILALSRLLHLRGHSHYLHHVYFQLFTSKRQNVPISVVITTFRRQNQLREAIKSVLKQSLPSDQFELIIVNNDPSDRKIRKIVDDTIRQSQRGNKIKFQLIDCPVAGLSAARNSALVHAKGEILCFLDDDAIAKENWLQEIQIAYSLDKMAGVVGGQIILNSPTPKPKILKIGLERFWSEFKPNYQDYTVVKSDNEFPWGANWSAKRQALLNIGGFRLKYGRKGNDFSGGEEIIAAISIRRLGFNIGIMPAAIVFHEPAAARYTLKNLLRTIQSQIVISHRMSKDGYLDRDVDIKNDFQGVLNNMSRIGHIIRIPNSEKKIASQIEYLGYILGWFSVLKERIIDFIARLTIKIDE